MKKYITKRLLTLIPLLLILSFFSFWLLDMAPGDPVEKKLSAQGIAVTKEIIEAERIYGDDNWSLDTILQEKGNLHLYEKLGYKRTGKMEKISGLMDIIYFEKN